MTKERPVLRDLLGEHPILQDLKGEHLDLVADHAKLIEFPAGQYILREGEEANEFYLLVDGAVSLGTFIPGRGFIGIQELGPGELLGWSWLIPPHHWHFDALVVQSTTTIAVDGKALRQKGQEVPAFGYELLRQVSLVVGQRLRSTRSRLS